MISENKIKSPLLKSIHIQVVKDGRVDNKGEKYSKSLEIWRVVKLVKLL